MGKVSHGHTVGGASPTYVSWVALKIRANHPERNVGYPYPEIYIDPRYNDFNNFLEDVGERPSLAYSIDRYPDPFGGYVPGNLRWATRDEQSQNRTNTKFTFEQAVGIAVDRLRGESCRFIAEKWGCSESLPREIVKGRAWEGALEKAQEALDTVGDVEYVLHTYPKKVRRGEQNNSAKLTVAKVRKIRALNGLKPQHVVAGLFNINRASVSLIWNRKTWTHV